MKRIVLKLSSGLLVQDGAVQKEWLDKLGQLIAELYEDEYRVWLVTSGAFALGKLQKSRLNLTDENLVISGQKEMFKLYKQAFLKSGLDVSEVLLDKDQFERRLDYLAIKNQLEALGSKSTIALINEHESDFSNQKFSDNDEIAGLVASLINAERVILSSTVQGLLDRAGKCVREIKFGDRSWTNFVNETTSATGRGGMLLKCKAAEHSAQRGVEAVICDGKEIRNIKASISGEAVGTRFAADRRLSARKRWILDKKESLKGVIQVDEGLAAAILSGQAVSLLTVGVTAIDGDFTKDEIVAIRSGKSILGYGQVRLDASTVRESMSNSQNKMLIHYDQYVRVLS